MSIKYACLGLLAEAPSHGYAIRTAFEERLGDFWELNYGQVYQVLSALEQEGLIIGRDEQIGRRPPRKVFAISPKGREALRRWLEHPTARKTAFRDEFYVRLLFANERDQGLLDSMLELQVHRCEEHLASLVDQRDGTVARSYATAARHLYREAAILHAQADLRALELCRTVLTGSRENSVAPRAARPAQREAEHGRRMRGRA